MKFIIHAHAPIKAAKWLLFLLVIAAVIYSCKEKYLAPVADNNINYLVVEGLINTGNDSTIIRLSRTIKLNGNAVPAAEKGAVVTVENSNAQSVTLPEIKPGIYVVPRINIDKSGQLRLKIRTANNKEYVSDFVESKVTPPLDSITYDFKNNNLNVQVNTVDPSGNSEYYLYSFLETYEYSAAFHSAYKIANGQIVQRVYPQEDVYVCWRTAPSTTIGLLTTTANREDRLDHSTLIRIPPNSQKISIEYSVLVTQSVLTKQGFDFWEALRKNTEQIGSIFDSQPSLLNGNIHSVTNPGEYVIGYISAGTTSQKRIFIPKSKLPSDWYYKETGCFTDTLSASEIINYRPPLYPIEPAIVDAVQIGWVATDYLGCIDCRLKGGTTTKPSFWH